MAKKKTLTQEQVFLADVAANGGDDVPRLVYADWLEDNGQAERAEFIRLQCRLATLDEFDPQRQELEQRHWEFLIVRASEWIKQTLPGWARFEGTAGFPRGFIDRFSTTASSLLKHGPGLFAVAPIRDLHLRISSHRWADIAASPLLARLATLNLEYNGLHPEALRALLASPHLTGLTSLLLNRTN